MQVSDPRVLYIHRINDVFDYIRTHLSDDLTLDVLARVAHFPLSIFTASSHP